MLVWIVHLTGGMTPDELIGGLGDGINAVGVAFLIFIFLKRLARKPTNFVSEKGINLLLITLSIMTLFIHFVSIYLATDLRRQFPSLSFPEDGQLIHKFFQFIWAAEFFYMTSLGLVILIIFNNWKKPAKKIRNLGALGLIGLIGEGVYFLFWWFLQ